VSGATRSSLAGDESLTLTPADATPRPGDSRPVSTRRGSARTTLLNVLGEFALAGPDRAPLTGGLVRVLGEVGIGHFAARQAIRRCAQSGWITGVKDGREARWTVTAAGRELLTDGIARVEALGKDFDEWDGQWLIVIASIPQELRRVREGFYRALRWNGFGSPMPGLWISAHCERSSKVRSAIRRCGLERSTACFAGTALSLGVTEDELVAQAWDLPQLVERYQEIAARFSQIAGHDPTEALRALLGLDEELQTVPFWDPQLPDRLTDTRPGRQPGRQLLSLRATWLEAAQVRWAQLQS
jgi:phenylacetic acid degradation operon negative regulatory protein